MKYISLFLLLLAGCNQADTDAPNLGEKQMAVSTKSGEIGFDPGRPPGLSDIRLANEKARHKTKLLKKEKAHFPVEEPPEALFDLVEYAAALGPMPAYITKPNDRTKKHPAIIWIVGGFSNSISDVAWADTDPENDQSASAFWKTGVVTLYPSFRGGNENPGFQETFYGEVEDVIAAARYLATVDYVDPDKIYLGGHSTGGTLALLVAASTDLFRGVFALGPVEDARSYGQENVAFDVNDDKEGSLRAPMNWLHGITTPTFVFEGGSGNISSLYLMQISNKNARIHFHPLEDYGHFDIIRPVSKLISEKINDDSGEPSSLNFTQAELMRALQSNQ